jgi:hypothetical protein
MAFIEDLAMVQGFVDQRVAFGITLGRIGRAAR